MNGNLYLVKKFHEKFNIEINKKPTIVSDKIKELRISLLIEEVKELTNAITKDNEIEILDGLCDCLYVLLGTTISLGYQDYIERAFLEIHLSNMTKSKTNKNSLGKIMKGKNFITPDLKTILES